MSEELIAAVERNDVGTAARLLGEGADPNSEDREGKCALMYAVEARHLEMTRLLLDHGAVVTAEWSVYGGMIQTPLSLAAGSGSLEIVDLLLDRGAPPDSVIDPEWPGDYIVPLVAAAGAGHTEVIRRLLDRAPWDEAAVLGAAHACQPEALRLLLACGQPISQETLDNGLVQAAARGFYVETARIVATLKLLLERGGRLRSLEKDAESLLLRIAGQGRPEAVLLLLEHEAARHSLWEAAAAGDAEETSAHLSTQDYSAFERNYALLLAARGGPPRDPGRVCATISHLLAHGADPNDLSSGHNGGPLATAILWGYPQSVTLLQRHGANINAHCPTGHTPLQQLLSCLPPDASLLDRLLAHGADINDAEANTALFEAARLGQEETVRLLLERGADPNRLSYDRTQGKPGFSPLTMALVGNKKEGIVRMLREAGARE